MVIYAYYDLLGMMIFAIAIHIYTRRSVKITNVAEADDITTADYSIHIKGFDKNTNEEELQEHFEQYGEVVEIKMIKDFQGTFYQFVKLSKLKFKVMLEKQKLEPGTDNEKKFKRASDKYDAVRNKLIKHKFF